MHGLMGGGWKRKRPDHGHHGWDDLAGNRGNADPGTYHRTTPPRLPPTLLKYGNSARHFDKIRYYAKMRLAIVLRKRHKRSREFGWSVVAYSGNELGLIGLVGTVVAPRPFRPWLRDRPNAGGERRR